MTNSDDLKLEAEKIEKDEERRRELADFLRSRRERLKPAFGKSQMSRRRTPGLRREEVAEIAHVGATWYTWLEQARDIRASAEALERIGKALELDPFEMKHLFVLAGKLPLQQDEVLTNEVIPEALRKIVDEVLHVPAMVIGERFDCLHWNSLYSEWIVDLGMAPHGKINWLEFILTNPDVRKRNVDWETVGRQLVAEFRADIGDRVGTPWVQELVERLKAKSPDFVRWWRGHGVQERKPLTIEIIHPKAGRTSFERTVFVPAEAPKLRIVIFRPIGPLPKF